MQESTGCVFRSTKRHRVLFMRADARPQNAGYGTDNLWFLSHVHAAATQVQMDPGSDGLEREQLFLKCPETLMCHAALKEGKQDMKESHKDSNE